MVTMVTPYRNSSRWCSWTRGAACSHWSGSLRFRSPYRNHHLVERPSCCKADRSACFSSTTDQCISGGRLMKTTTQQMLTNYFQRPMNLFTYLSINQSFVLIETISKAHLHKCL